MKILLTADSEGRSTLQNLQRRTLLKSYLARYNYEACCSSWNLDSVKHQGVCIVSWLTPALRTVARVFGQESVLQIAKGGVMHRVSVDAEDTRQLGTLVEIEPHGAELMPFIQIAEEYYTLIE